MNSNNQKSVIYFIKKLGRPVFTTFELTQISGKSQSTIVQSLNYLEKQGIIFKIYKGIWGEVGGNISAYSVVPFLFFHSRAYVSFISALHLYGIIEQIPKVVTVASISHTRIIKTEIATYEVHRISPSFFDGFVWYKGQGSFLIAEPEKALIDSLYLSARKKKQFSYFPELHIPETFSFKKAEDWIKKIKDKKIRKNVYKKFLEIKQVRSEKLT